ncbi:AAA family ATPase [Rheinheimera sp. WS51]|uniref:AAA family ATPase n=1 Tax=Rheinheimera sp. WS51 TaxID=3425886 RepID=UPI003D901E62
MKTHLKSPIPCHYLAAFYAKRVLALVDTDISYTNVNRTTLRGITGRPFSDDKELANKQVLAFLDIHDDTPALSERVRLNMVTLCQLFSVNPDFAPALGFIALMNINQGLNRMVDLLGGHLEEKALEWLLCDLASMNSDEVTDCLMQLQQSGLLIIDRWLDEPQDIIITPSLLNVITTERVQSKTQLLKHVLCPCLPTKLKADDFSYVDTELLLGYLSQAMMQQHTGVNILLYGEAGSGKTELAKVLARTLALKLFEARNMRIDEGYLSGEFGAKSADTQRLQYITMVQSLMADSNMLLLVDECESLFYSADIHYSKESVHRLLEQNAVPAIWITNHVQQLEPSFIRRFKLVMAVNSPQEQILQTISKAEFKGLAVSTEFQTRLSKIPNLTPALIANAGHVTHTLGLKRSLAQGVIEDVVQNTLTACDLWDDSMRYQSELPFDMAMLNIQQPASVLKQISHAIAINAPIRVLLSGPSGTGKTALAHYMAEQHNRQIKRVLSSDILSKYVGDSERQIAALFQSAHRDNHVMLLDEVDSLLTSRERLNAQHERQVVNELLAQLECFTQPLFAATNFETALDSAVLRRFDFKLQCNYLTAPQVITLYKRTVSATNITKDETTQLTTLDRLTPGDFALLSRRLRFSPVKEHRPLALNVLMDENKRKQPTPTIGFVR